MEFRLLYTGYLPPASNNDSRAAIKHDIRRYLHPQLKHLWKIDKNLRQHATTRGRLTVPEGTTEYATLGEQEFFERGIAYLGSRYGQLGFNFVPLAEEQFALSCSLDILFLREGDPGRLVENGDIDNRIKVLFDALRKPKNRDELAGASPEADENPFFVLLEDDLLISEVKVTTDRILKLPATEARNRWHSHIVITVKLLPTQNNAARWIF